MSAVLKPQVDFRPMVADDLETVMAVEVVAYPFPWTRGNFADSLRSGYRAWVCEDAGRMVAYGLVTVTLDEAQLLNITVSPELQGRGLGGNLLAHLMDDSRNAGARRMFLEVRPSNTGALALYQRSGFLRVGLRKAYYPAREGREDAIVMAREL